MRKQTKREHGTNPFARKQLLSEIRSFIQQGALQVAFETVAPLTRRNSKDPDAWILRAMIEQQRGNMLEVARCAQKSIDSNPTAMGYLLLASSHRPHGRTDEAIACCEKALQLEPSNNQVKLTQGSILEEAGRFDEARAIIEPLREELLRTDSPILMQLHTAWAKLLVQQKRFEEAIALIDTEIDVGGVNDDMLAGIMYLKAKACDRQKEFDDSFAAASRANEINKVEFSPSIYEEQVTVLCDNWSKEAMEHFPASQNKSDVPVFVAGMPRSGTSLIDQIIDAHPLAAGVGELSTIELFARQLSMEYDSEKSIPECFGKFQRREWTKIANAYEKEITKLAPVGVKRIVNKALGNNKLVGLVAKLFPNTRIIHAMRDPRDMAISCFMGGFNNRMHPWTTELEWCAAAWAQSSRMMQHWIESLDVPVLEVRYEELVRDPETQFPRIIEFLGLEWDDSCTKFHESKRTVRTLSYDQVNKPLYTTSAGRHTNYEQYIQNIDWPTY